MNTKKLVIFIGLLSLGVHAIFSMENGNENNENKEKKDPEYAIGAPSSIQELRGETWDWFITHVNLTCDNKEIECDIFPFDPAIRFIDRNTKGLVMTVQRLTFEEGNTSFPNIGLSMGKYKDASGYDKLFLLLDHGERLFCLAVGHKETGNNKIQIYDREGRVDTSIEIDEEGISVLSWPIRLWPYRVPPDNNIKGFLRTLREEKDTLNKNEEKP